MTVLCEKSGGSISIPIQGYVSEFTFKGSNSFFFFLSPFSVGVVLTLLHSKRQKLQTVLAFLGARGLRKNFLLREQIGSHKSICPL